MRRRLICSLATLATVAGPASANEASDAVAVVRAMVDAINARDFEALDAVVAPDVRRHCAATPGVEVHSLEDLKKFLRQDLAAVPDARQELDVIFGTDSMVGLRAIYSGTQSGPMGPFPPSGRKLEVPFLGLVRVEKGKIAEIWVEWDNLSALTQLGHIRPPAAPGQSQAKP